MISTSIIIPAYNAVKTISSCLDSILLDPNKDFEVIVIDDGSKDATLSICEKYAKGDTRVRVIHVDNSGVSSARNLGIKLTQGENVIFVDSDDCLNVNILSYIRQNADFDLLICGYETVSNDGSDLKKIQLFSTKAELLSYCEYNDIINSPWAKVFKKSIISKNNLLFDTSLSFGEDHLFVLDYILCSDNIKSCPLNVYKYFCNNYNSLVNNKLNISALLDYTKKCRQKHDDILLKIDDCRLECAANNRYLRNIKFIINKVNQGYDYVFHKYLVDYLKAYDKKAYLIGLTFSEKSMFYILSSFPYCISYFSVKSILAIKKCRNKLS